VVVSEAVVGVLVVMVLRVASAAMLVPTTALNTVWSIVKTPSGHRSVTQRSEFGQFWCN